MSLLSRQNGPVDGNSLLMASPGVGVDPKRVRPSEVRFVLHPSGSTAGQIDGAKRKIRARRQ